MLLRIISVFMLLWVDPVSTADIVHDKQLEVTYEPQTLVSIFTRKMIFFGNGKRIHVFVKPINSIEHNSFLFQWLGISTYRYKKLLNVQVYSGKNSNVKEVHSDAEMLMVLSSTPYSIGYMTNGDIVYNHGYGDGLMVIMYE